MNNIITIPTFTQQSFNFTSNIISPISITKIEKMIKSRLENIGYNPISQYPLKITLIDIAFPEKKLAIYCDGDYWHNLPGYKERDTKINTYLKENGWTVLRFWEHEINDNLEVCINKIMEEMK